MINWIGSTLQDILSKDGIFIRWFLDFNILFLLFILTFVGFIIIAVITSSNLRLMTYENNILEFFWTSFPSIILIILGIPSIKLLYKLELKRVTDIRLKITGHQWYWRYDYRNFNNLAFDSFLKPQGRLAPGEPRLLETDNHLILPLVTARVAVSSDDVLHRWAIPSLGIKIDANPGRINTFYIRSNFPGIYYGQCSEICGANHSFIPITLEYTLFKNFKTWVKEIK